VFIFTYLRVDALFERARRDYSRSAGVAIFSEAGLNLSDFVEIDRSALGYCLKISQVFFTFKPFRREDLAL
jgi:hypothetical protein